jgi:hypothetical protein
MAFGKINETRDNNVAFKKYVGVAPVKVIAINPTLKELQDLGLKFTEEVQYVSKTDDGFDQIRIDFWVKTLADKCDGIDTMFKIPFILKKKTVVGSNSGKYRIMDIYGQTAWGTKDEIQNKQIPQYATGPAKIDAKYHVLCDGEEELTMFVRAYLGIPNVIKFANGLPCGMIDNPADAEGTLDYIKDYFTGNISELKDIFKLAPNNWVKCLVGVKTTDDNKQYQTVFTKGFMSGGASNYKHLSKLLQENLAVGRYANVYFGPIVGDTVMLNPITEYVVEATAVTPANATMPATDKMPDFDNNDLPF